MVINAVLVTHAHLEHSGCLPARAPKQIYITHGEPDAADALRIRIKRELGWSTRVPEHLERVELCHAR